MSLQSNIDLEHIEQTLQQRGFAFIVDRLQKALKAERERLETRQNERDTEFTRGQIAGLKTALDVPAILIEEWKQKANGTRRR